MTAAPGPYTSAEDTSPPLVLVLNAKQQPIAEVYGDSKATIDTAALLAASWELREALAQAFELFEGRAQLASIIDTTGPDAAWLKQARAALDKANGEASSDPPHAGDA